MDPDVPLTQPMLQRKQFERTISQELMFARLAEFFGLLAAMLVATGLYGTLSYRVNTRTAEIGVRMAVGARREQVVWMILKGSLLLTAAGLMMGVPLAMLVGRGLTSSLYGVQPLDAASYLLSRGGRDRGCAGSQCGACCARGKCESIDRTPRGVRERASVTNPLFGVPRKPCPCFPQSRPRWRCSRPPRELPA